MSFEQISKEQHWETLGGAGSIPKGGALWRRHADRLNENLLSQWLPYTEAAVLKTDLFDEANGQGQHALLRSRAMSTIGIDIASGKSHRFLRLCHGFETLQNTPLRFLSGYFAASLSRRPLESR